MHGVYGELAELYGRSELEIEEKKRAKARVLGTLEDRVRGEGIHYEERYLQRVRGTSWNNAVILGFQRYNSNFEAFERSYNRQGADLTRFFEHVEKAGVRVLQGKPTTGSSRESRK